MRWLHRAAALVLSAAPALGAGCAKDAALAAPSPSTAKEPDVNGSQERDEAELRALFAEWSRASTAKDIERTMAPIAHDCLSYEHQSPLQYRGVDSIRESCQQGFDAAEGELRWDVPDLQVMVRGDLAITWGLNRMRITPPGGAQKESWSRGTRVFRKVDGRWKMIHQHVSFPFDPASGRADTALAP
jgi:uncharacterized protein (TIGR02246 family)